MKQRPSKTDVRNIVGGRKNVWSPVSIFKDNIDEITKIRLPGLQG